MIYLYQSSMLLLNSYTSRLFSIWSLALLCSGLPSIAQGYTDGPYIFLDGDNINIKYILDGQPMDEVVSSSTATFKVDGLPEVDLTDLNRKTTYKATYRDVDRIFAMSDIHGQYDLMIELLQGNKIIDQDKKWSFGEGHLVITGDNFDRGDKVMDVLWFLYHLEAEAEQAGGKVHVLLGNHESMVLNNDLRYLNRKYLYTSGALKTRYDQLFRPGSVLGDWLTNHNVLLSINDVLYTHGGVSLALLDQYNSIDEINKDYISFLIQRDGIPSSEKIETLIYQDGPLWYRGYFDEEQVDIDTINQILEKLDQRGIIVGHTSLDEITSLHDGKVLAIDCSIKLGKQAQGLLITDGAYFGSDTQGHRTPLKGPPSPASAPDTQDEKKSLFDHLHDSGDRAVIEIDTDVKRLINKSSKEEYQPSTTSISYSGKSFALPTRVRARGNMRKKVCRHPPIKIDFKDGQLDSMGYAKCDKLKLVIPCDGSSGAQAKLYDEYLIYGMYQIIEPRGIRATLAQVILREGSDVKKDLVGFVVEDEEQYALKNDAVVIENGKVTEFALQRASYLKMCFFQYMISNTDWAIANKHNVEIVKLPGMQRVVALPYDFDYAGFVGQNYAVPHESLPIETVDERHFVPKKVTEGELTATADYFMGLESKFHDYIDSLEMLTEKSRKKHHKHIDEFYKIIKSPKSMKRRMMR